MSAWSRRSSPQRSSVARSIGAPSSSAAAQFPPRRCSLSRIGSLAVDCSRPSASSSRHGHLRPGLRQRPGHRGDVGRCRWEGAPKILTSLDAVGNTTKADHQGHRHRDRRLAATALFGSTPTLAGSRSREHGKPRAQAGPVVPDRSASVWSHPADPGRPHHRCRGRLLFSGLAISAVTRAARAIVFEVRRQFREIPGIMEGTAKPGVRQGRRHLHRDSLRELATPASRRPCRSLVGFGLGIVALGSYLAGDRRQCTHGGLPGQRRWRLGQRQEARRRRPPRRQGAATPTWQPSSATPSATRSGHGRPGDQPADQGHEPRLGSDRARHRHPEHRLSANAAARYGIAAAALLVVVMAVTVSQRRSISSAIRLYQAPSTCVKATARNHPAETSSDEIVPPTYPLVPPPPQPARCRPPLRTGPSSTGSNSTGDKDRASRRPRHWCSNPHFARHGRRNLPRPWVRRMTRGHWHRPPGTVGSSVITLWPLVLSLATHLAVHRLSHLRGLLP